MNFRKQIFLDPETAFDSEKFQAYIINRFDAEQNSYRVVKRSIDARGSKTKVFLSLEFYKGNVPYEEQLKPRDVSHSSPVIIVGSGPAGLFAAIELIHHGLKPIVIERGKDVQSRRRDIAAINKDHKVDPNSNYCFGEGGAGTFSDGKLYTRSKKRGNVQKVLDILVEFGAKESIRFDAHPHIGTNKLPDIIIKIREYILDAGGEVIFNTSVKDFIIDKDLKGVITDQGDRMEGLGVILATGHSARDIFHLLKKKKIEIERKPFAIGLRVEHPQELIDSIQYPEKVRGDFLPAASYSVVSQSIINKKQRGVFSFCMCPGGFMVPSATAEGEVVVNGMSPSRRDGKYANSGIVVAVENEDISSEDPLANLEFQQQIEQEACNVSGGTQTAPGQRLEDFLNQKVSTNLPDCSYQPGVASVELREVLPEHFIKRLCYGLKDFGRSLPGFITNDALLVGVESRTSSPVKIPRDKLTLEHVQLARLYPCGEGAGFAGGIVSAAVDGINCAEALVAKYGKKIKVK